MNDFEYQTKLAKATSNLTPLTYLRKEFYYLCTAIKRDARGLKILHELHNNFTARSKTALRRASVETLVLVTQSFLNRIAYQNHPTKDLLLVLEAITVDVELSGYPEDILRIAQSIPADSNYLKHISLSVCFATHFAVPVRIQNILAALAVKDEGLKMDLLDHPLLKDILEAGKKLDAKTCEKIEEYSLEFLDISNKLRRYLDG